jgi:hypothetical protein
MFEMFFTKGLRPENCLIIGKNYSTNLEVFNELSHHGCRISSSSICFEPTISFDEWFTTTLKECIAMEFAALDISKFEKILLLDDGGFLHLFMNDTYPNLTNVYGVEQTSSGHHRIHEKNVKFPWVSVARSFHKLQFETPYIGKLGAHRIKEHLKDRGNPDPHILCVGLGPIGKNIAGQLDHEGYLCECVDVRDLTSHEINSGALMKLVERNRILTHAHVIQKLSYYDVIIGCTGKNILKPEDIGLLHPQVSLISMSSSDREFPAVAFRTNGGAIHNNYYQGKRCLVNGGFPITFWGKRNCIPPQQIEFTIALLAINILSLARNAAISPTMEIESIRQLWQPDTGSEEWYKEN